MDGKIRFDDQMANLRDLLDRLNKHAHQHQIDIVEIDAGVDTRRRLHATISESVERKRLAREGVITKILEL
jgi:hypothetical protein